MKKRRIEGQAHWRREKRYDFTILRSLVELDDCIAGSGHEQRGRCTVQNPVNAGYVALEVVLATEEASAHLTWESWWKSALVAHVPHQIL